MSQFRLRVQLLLVSLSLAAGFLLFGAWTWHTIDASKVGGPAYQRVVLYKDLVADILPPPNYIIESYLTVLQLADPDRAVDHDRLTATLRKLRADYDARHAFWQQQDLPDALKTKFLDEAHAAARRFYDLADGEFLAAVKEGNTGTVRSTLARLEAEYLAHRTAIDAVVAMATREQTAVETATHDDLARDLMALVLVFAVSGAIAAATNVLFGRALLDGIGRARARLLAIAQGNLCETRDTETRADEIGDLLRTLDQTAATLRDTVGQIRSAAASVGTAAEQLSASASGVAAATCRQSDSVAAVAATVEGMSTGVVEMAQLAIQSRARAIDAGTRCETGNAQIATTAVVVEQLAGDVQATGQAVNALGEQSREISTIVAVIRGIADQTNLLALNAAIEAARAGEHGRGFAVVADEVRKLAERTAQSTDQIARMIEQIQVGVDASVRGMREGSERANASIEAVRAARAIMDEIAAETRTLVADIQNMAQQLEAQRHGSEEIAGEVAQIASSSEENSAAVSQVSGTAAELSATAGHLQTTVGFFRT